MANLRTLVSGSSITLTVTEGQFVVLNNGRSDVARLTIATGPGAGRVVTAQHNGRRVYGPFGAGTIIVAAVSGNCGYELSGDATSQLADDDGPLSGAEIEDVRTILTQGGALVGWQDFATAPDGSPSSTDNGLPWALTVGSGHGANAAMRVVSGRLTNTTTDAAARAGYAEFDAGGPISRMGCRFALGAGGNGGSATVVAWATSVTANFAAAAGVPDTPLHLSITPINYRLSYWLGGSETVLVNSIAFATPLTNDGTTEYQVEMARDGGNWTLWLPDGTTLSGFSAAIANIPARWACIENFQTNASSDSRASFGRVWARTASAGADKFLLGVDDRAGANAYARAVALATAAGRVATVEYAPGTADDKALTTSNAEVDTTNLRTSFTFGPSGAAIVDVSGVCIHSGGGLFVSAYINGGASGQVVVARRNATVSGSGEEFRARLRITGTVGSTVTVGLGAYVTAGTGTLRANGPAGHRICMTVTPT